MRARGRCRGAQGQLQSEILAIDAPSNRAAADQNAYVITLRNNNMTPAMFEQRLVRDLASRARSPLA